MKCFSLLSVLSWLIAHFLWLCFLPLCSAIQVVFVLCDVDAFVVDYHFLDTVLIFMLYGWCVVPFIYLGSFLFSSSTTAYIKITLFNYFSTVFSIIIHTVIKNHGKNLTQFSFFWGGEILLNTLGWKGRRLKYVKILKSLCFFGNQ